MFVVFSGHHREHHDKHGNVKEIHITENLQKLEAHGWKVRALVMLLYPVMTFRIIIEKKNTHTFTITAEACRRSNDGCKHSQHFDRT